MHRTWRRTCFACALVPFVFFSVVVPARGGLIINLNLLSGDAPVNAVGGGTLQSVVAAAAKVWENIFSSTSFSHTLNLSYRWGVQTGSTLAAHSLISEGGSPHRETAGLIVFDNDGSSVFFVDPTLDPYDPLNGGNSEYSTFLTSSADFGGGTMNTSRRFSGASGLASGRTDLFSVALHEIGHALGMSGANDAYSDETLLDNDVDITAPFAFAGSAIPTNNAGMTLNAHLNVANALLFPSISSGARRLPSVADILANAQLSQFFNPLLDLDFSSIPEPSTLVLTSVVVGGAWLQRRRRKSESTDGTSVVAPAGDQAVVDG